MHTVTNQKITVLSELTCFVIIFLGFVINSVCRCQYAVSLFSRERFNTTEMTTRRFHNSCHSAFSCHIKYKVISIPEHHDDYEFVWQMSLIICFWVPNMNPISVWCLQLWLGTSPGNKGTSEWCDTAKVGQQSRRLHLQAQESSRKWSIL